jgi:hypothetical protein
MPTSILATAEKGGGFTSPAIHTIGLSSGLMVEIMSSPTYYNPAPIELVLRVKPKVTDPAHRINNFGLLHVSFEHGEHHGVLVGIHSDPDTRCR